MVASFRFDHGSGRSELPCLHHISALIRWLSMVLVSATAKFAWGSNEGGLGISEIQSSIWHDIRNGKKKRSFTEVLLSYRL